MNPALQIVNALLEDDPKDFILGQARGPEDNPTTETITFGMFIQTTEGFEWYDQLEELGLMTATHHPQPGIMDQLNRDASTLERNAYKIVRNNGFNFRDEGHDVKGDLIGTVTVKAGSPEWEKVREALSDSPDPSEPWRTSSGSIWELDGAGELLFQNVSELGQSVIDVAIGVFDTEELESAIEDHRRMVRED